MKSTSTGEEDIDDIKREKRASEEKERAYYFTSLLLFPSLVSFNIVHALVKTKNRGEKQ
jgi:hypothetical protein